MTQLNSIKPDKFKELLRKISAACSWEFNSKTITVWWELFKDYPEEILVRAFDHAIKNIDYKPLPKHIYEGIKHTGYQKPVNIKTTPPIVHGDCEPIL